MSKTNVLIYTNVGKSQIEETDTHFKISGIPVTKNNSVMNRVAYFESDNAEGMPTIEEQPITLRHPEVDGVNVSAKQGKGLMYFSGSLVGNSYLDKGVWKVDTLINKKKLAAQDDGERWTEILSNKETFGVSTGLTFTRNEQKGDIDGEEYDMVAMGQNYDHLAFLDPKVEAPAGGENTMVRFNANVEQGEIIVCNIDEHDPLTPSTVQNEPLNESAFNKLVEKLKGVFAPAQDKGYNSQEFDVNQPNEGSIMNRDEMLEALGLATNSQVTDDELKTLMKSKLAANASEGFTKEDVESIVNAAIKPLADQLTANANKELDQVAEQVAALNKGLDADDAKALGLEKAKAFLAANGKEYVADGYGGPQSRTTQTNSDNGEYRSQKPGIEE